VSFTFLTKPAVQGFVDPVQGKCGTTGALNAVQNIILGKSSFNAYGSLFNIATGALRSSQQWSAISISPDDSTIPCFVFDTDASHIWTDKDDTANNVGFAQVDPTTGPWTVSATWGFSSGFSQLPNNVPYFQDQCWLAGAGSFWLVQCGIGNLISVCQASLDIGFWGHQYVGVSGASYTVVPGPQSSSQATAYWTGFKSNTTYVFGATVISLGADGYSPSSWPTPNGFITSAQIASYAPTDFNPAWTGIQAFAGPAYDTLDGNVIVGVSGSDGVTTTNYIAKLNASTGAVLWKTAVESADGFAAKGFKKSRIQNGYYIYFAQLTLSSGTLHVIETPSGTDHTMSISASIFPDNQSSDDVLGCVFCDTSWSGSGITLLNSTTASGNSMAALYFIDNITRVQPKAGFPKSFAQIQGFI